MTDKSETPKNRNQWHAWLIEWSDGETELTDSKDRVDHVRVNYKAATFLALHDLEKELATAQADAEIRTGYLRKELEAAQAELEAKRNESERRFDIFAETSNELRDTQDRLTALDQAVRAVLQKDVTLLTADDAEALEAALTQLAQGATESAAGQENGQLCNAEGTPEAPESRPVLFADHSLGICGAAGRSGLLCGFPPKHKGPHSWEDKPTADPTPSVLGHPACNYNIDGWCRDTQCMDSGKCKIDGQIDTVVRQCEVAAKGLDRNAADPTPAQEDDLDTACANATARMEIIKAKKAQQPVAVALNSPSTMDYGVRWLIDKPLPHGTTLYTAPPQDSETVRVPREQLEHWAEYWNHSTNERAMEDALCHILGEINDALADRAGDCGRDSEVEKIREQEHE